MVPAGSFTVAFGGQTRDRDESKTRRVGQNLFLHRQVKSPHRVTLPYARLNSTTTAVISTGSCERLREYAVGDTIEAVSPMTDGGW